MGRIRYGKNTPLSFCESVTCDFDAPYVVRIKHFHEEDLCPLHYSDETVEILLCDKIDGEIIIENLRFAFENKQVFIMPASCIHSMRVYPCVGTMHVLHFSLNEIGKYINISYWAYKLGLDIANIYQPIQDAGVYDMLYECISRLIASDDIFVQRVHALLDFFDILQKHMASVAQFLLPPEKQNNQLKKLIHWTLENYSKPLSINCVANYIGFSKTYFCSWFKQNTGMTYMQYVNTIRINQACHLLINSEASVSEISYAIGYDDVSYFIQVFKRAKGITPRKFSQKMPL